MKTILILFLSTILSTFAQYDSLQTVDDHFFNSYSQLIDSESDTLFATNFWADEAIVLVHSTNLGTDWTTSLVRPKVKLKNRYSASAIRLSNIKKNFFVAWADDSTGIGFAKTTVDDPLSFRDTNFFPEYQAKTIHASQNQNKSTFVVSGTLDGSVELYKIKTSDLFAGPPLKIDSLSNSTPSVSLVHTGSDRMTIFYTYKEKDDFTTVYYRKSTDNGVTWSERIQVPNNLDQNIQNISAIELSSHELFILYEVNFETEFVDENNNDKLYNRDVFYYKSTDGGSSWINNRLTTFIGEDEKANLIEIDGELVTILYSYGRPTDSYHSYLCYIEHFIDLSPPEIRFFKNSTIERNQPYNVTTYIIDNYETPNGGIEEVFVTVNSLDTIQLFDDGLHNDGFAGDYIWGNEIPPIQYDQPREEQVVNINNISLPFSNTGLVADVTAASSGAKITLVVTDKNYNVERLSKSVTDVDDYLHGALYDNTVFLYASGFTLCGKNSNGEVWANSATRYHQLADYIPGMVGSNPSDPKNQIYIVRRDDQPFGATWEFWRDAVKIGAKFYDGDGDGQYNPVDKNENGLWDPDEDKPDLLYDETYFTTFNDGKPASERYWGSEPLGLEVNQTIFASSKNSILNDVIFIRYRITNKGESLNDIYFTTYADADIGDYQDDIFGSDTSLHSSFYFNNQYDEEYGEDAPAFFTSIVQGPIVESPGNVATLNYGPDLGQDIIPDYKNLGMTASTVGVRPLIYLPTPDNPQEMYYYARGLTPAGDIPDPCQFYYGEFFGSGCEDVNPYLWYSGDPVANSGWLNSVTYDIGGYTSTGPFNLDTDENTEIIVAYVVGRGNDFLQSVTRAREITQYVHEEYQRNFSTIVGVEDEPEEVVNSFSLSQNYPNPFNPATTIKFTLPNHPSRYQGEGPRVRLVVYDILGRKVKTLVNEVKSPGNYEVQFDASQLASGVYFYRLTAGEFVQTKKMMLIK